MSKCLNRKIWSAESRSTKNTGWTATAPTYQKPDHIMGLRVGVNPTIKKRGYWEFVKYVASAIQEEYQAVNLHPNELEYVAGKKIYVLAKNVKDEIKKREELNEARSHSNGNKDSH